MNYGPLSKKQEHLNPADPSNIGDAWIWRAIALPSHLRVITHLSHGRSEEEAITFLAAFKARTNGRPPLFTSDKLPAYGKALISNYSPPEPPPIKRKPGRSEEHTSELQSQSNLVCRLLLEKKNKDQNFPSPSLTSYTIGTNTSWRNRQSDSLEQGSNLYGPTGFLRYELIGPRDVAHNICSR